MRYIYPLPLVWHNYLLFWLCGILAAAWPLPSLAAGATLGLLDRRLWRISRLFFCLALFALAFAFSSWHFYEARRSIGEAPRWLEADKKPPRICGLVKEVHGLPDNRARILLAGVKPAESSLEALPGLCAWTWDSPSGPLPLPGQTVCLSRPILPTHGFANDGEMDWSPLARDNRWRIWSKGQKGEPETRGEPETLAAWREKVLRNFMDISGGPGFWEDAQKSGQGQAKAMLLALLFGDRRYLSQETMGNFANAAIAHSLALSGQHLFLACCIGLALVRALAGIMPGLYLLKPRMALAAAASLPFAALYLWLGDAPQSLLRAACMLAILTFLIWRGSVFSGTDIICAALLLIMTMQPLAVFDAGLQMSILCVAVIIAFLPALRRLYPARALARKHLAGRIAARALQILLISVAIQALLLPLSLSRFGVAGLWLPFNVIWLPLLGAIVLPFAAIGLLLACLPGPFCLPLAKGAILIASLPCHNLLAALEFLKDQGFLLEPQFATPIWLHMLAFAALAPPLLWLLGNGDRASVRPKVRLPIFIGLALLAFAVCGRLFESMDANVSAEALDVGQAQAILLKFPGNGRILLDAGGSYSRRFDPGKHILAPYLSRNQAPQLAAAINSHPDLDHVGGFFYLADRFRLDSIFHNGREAAPKEREAWHRALAGNESHILKTGDRLVLGAPENGLRLEVLHPPAGEEKDWKGNDASLVLRLTRHGEGLALFMGDAGKKTIRRLLDSGADLSARAIFAPHHGSDKSFLAAFYKTARPQIVAASCGFRNHWRFPGRKLRAWLEKEGIPLLNTGDAGKIRIKFGEGGTEIESARR